MAKSAPEFVHLHVHSEYSLLDGLARIPVLVRRTKQLGMRALALTDHGAMYGVVEFYTEAKGAGLNPIIGCEAYVAPRRRDQREPKIDDKNYHLTLLAENETGYRNLIKLVTRAHLEGFYYKPRIDRELLEQYHGGLICLSGCRSAEVPRLILEDQPERARAVAAWYRSLFGPDRYYVELQDQGLPEQTGLNRQLLDLAREVDVPVVATNDLHYVQPEEHRAHDVLLCIQTNSTVEQENRMRMGTPNFYLRSPREMAQVFDGLPEALRHTLAIAERCDVRLQFDRVLLPHFEIPADHTPDSYLRSLAERGLRQRYGQPTSAHWERLNYELSVIEQTGYALYFLIVEDYTRWARQRAILAGPRGSVAGSLVIYCLGISDIDPLQHNIMFERFLHSERIGMPDIDMDFADDRRDEVIQYVTHKYGHHHVAQIITFGTMASRAAVRDVGRALGMPYGEVDRIAKLIPFGASLEEAAQVKELKALAEQESGVRDLLELARGLEGTPRNASTHAAGVVISRDPLIEHVPLQRGTRDEGGVICQWSWEVIEKVGLLKMDFLGLANLTILNRACDIIRETHDEAVDPYRLPIDYADERARRTYDMLGQGETTAVFQLESPGMRRCLKQLRPNQLSDLFAIVALYRPGPMEAISDFVAAKNGRREITYLHSDLGPILEETYGVIVYQDQVLQIARAIAGFSWGEADVLRKAMGKKITALMAEQRELFITRSIARGYDDSFAEEVWRLIEPFAGYGFPKGHAAYYAVVAYQTAYLKANYPAEYMAAVLTSESGNAAKVAEAVAECRRLGVGVLPPDVNRSGLTFALEPQEPPVSATPVLTIRFGLAAIKNVGEGAAEAIAAARDDGGPFNDLADFCRRVDLRHLNKRALESLIKAGALDSFTDPPGHRAALLAGLDTALALAQRHRRSVEAGQMSLFDGQKSGQIGALNFMLPVAEQVPRKERLAWEKEMLGLYLSEHPLAGVALRLQQVVSHTTADLSNDLANQTVTLGGFVASSRVIPTRRGDLMAAVELEDLHGSVEVIVFPRTYQSTRELWREDSVVLVRGRVDTRDDRPQVLCDQVEPFAAQEDAGAAGSGAAALQTGYPLTPSEAAAAEQKQGVGGSVSGARSGAGADSEEEQSPPDESGPAPVPSAGVRESVAGPDYRPGSEEPDDGTDGNNRRPPASDRRPSPGPTTGPPPVATPGLRPSTPSARVLELVVHRSRHEQSDVNRLVRLNAVMQRFPGHDRVLLRVVNNGREAVYLELADTVSCTDGLRQALADILGEESVRVLPPEAGPPGGIQQPRAS